MGPSNVRGALAAFLVAGVLLVADPGFSQSYCATYTLPARYWTPGFEGHMAYRLQIVDGRRILIAEGEVMQGESIRLSQALTGYRPIDEVWFNSPGGAALEGPQMGRVLRARGLMVRLPSHFACISACSYAFLGGAVRVVDPGAYYGVHMFSIGDDWLSKPLSEIADRAVKNRASGMSAANVDAQMRREISGITRPLQQDAAKMAAIRARYLVEMSLSLDFLTDAFETEAGDVCYLSREGINRYNVDNSH